MKSLFFELIQVAMGKRAELSSMPTDEQWDGILASMKKHTMMGMGYVAIQKLPLRQWPQKAQVMGFASAAVAIGRKNVMLDNRCREVCRELADDGFDAVVIKGQSNWENYPDELRAYRTPGDIDLWVAPHSNGKRRGNGVRETLRYACKRRADGNGAKSKVLYYHVDYLTANGLDVELHYRLSFLCPPLRNMRMQRWFAERFDECHDNAGQKGFPVLVPYVNVVYQLVHLFRHVFEGGVGLRQLMDYYYALEAWNGEGMSREEVMRVIRSFGLGRFAAAVMWVMREVFCNENDNSYSWMICEADEKEGRKLLADILRGGNFGKYDMHDRSLKRGGMAKHGLWKLKRMVRLVGSYPEEALWEPVFRVYHLLWRQRSMAK